jgi:hypothetical protein
MSDVLQQVALVSETQQISSADLNRASAAVQKQATRDFGAIGGYRPPSMPSTSWNTSETGPTPVVVN